MSFADLHTHSHYSDGADAPAAVVDRAVGAGVFALAITDHDTVDGVEEGAVAASAAGLDYLPGTEISGLFEHHEVHVVGLGIDPAHEALRIRLQSFAESRRVRFHAILDKLRDLDIHIAPPGGAREKHGGVLGRLHLARALWKAGYTKSAQEGFDRYIGAGRPAYVPKPLVPAELAIGMIHDAGGLAFVAHPGLGNTLRRMLPRLLALPFDGIEAYHVSHTPARTETLLGLAKDRNLLVAGGSDCHGSIKDRPLIGSVRVPGECYFRIMDALAAR